MDVQTAQAELLKIKANVVKDKAVLADKGKADAIKKLDEVLNALKPVLEKKKKIDATLASIAALKNEITAYNAALSKVTASARAAAALTRGHTKSDTPKRDFFMMTNYLTLVGQQTSIEGP